MKKVIVLLVAVASLFGLMRPAEAATYLHAPTLTYGSSQVWSAYGSGNCSFTGEATSYYGGSVRVRAWYSNCRPSNVKRVCIDLHNEHGTFARECDAYRTGNSAATFGRDWFGCTIGQNYTLTITFQGSPSAPGGVSYTWPLLCRNYYPG